MASKIFASLHGGMLQRADWPVEEVAPVITAERADASHDGACSVAAILAPDHSGGHPIPHAFGSKPFWLAPADKFDAAAQIVAEMTLPFERGLARKLAGGGATNGAAKVGEFLSAVASKTTRHKQAAPEITLKRKALTVRLLPRDHRRIRAAGAFMNRTSQDIMVSAMDEYLNQLGFTNQE